jgi:hypothetical protein
MTSDNATDLWDALIEHGATTEHALQVVANGWGFNLDNMETVLYVTTGYRSLEQWTEADFGLGTG